MPTIISHLKLIVPVIEEPPQELIDAYIKGWVSAAPKAYRHLKKALPDTKAVIAKLIKPSLKARQSLFNPEYYTRRGIQIKDIPAPDQDDLERWARRWLKKMQYVFGDTKELSRKMKFRPEIYLKEMARLNLPFMGFKDIIRGVGPVAARWLTGDQSVLGLIGSGDTFEGGPVDITRSGPVPTSRRGQAPRPGRGSPLAARFRGRFIRQILKTGSQIIKLKYWPDQIDKGNDKINRLVIRYARDKFVPFTPGGASHVDFMIEVTRLFLDIQVSTR